MEKLSPLLEKQLLIMCSGPLGIQNSAITLPLLRKDSKMEEQIKRDQSSSKVPVQLHIDALTGVIPKVFPALASSILTNLLMILPL